MVCADQAMLLVHPSVLMLGRRGVSWLISCNAVADFQEDGTDALEVRLPPDVVGTLTG